MPAVHFAFQEGFSNDTVVVRVDGNEVVRKSGLNSEPTIALADAANVSIDNPSSAVIIEVPTRGISNTFEVDVTEYPYLGISVAGTQVTMKRSKTPFEYM